MTNFEVGRELQLRGLTEYGKSIISSLGKKWTIVGLQSKPIDEEREMLMLLLESENQKDLRWVELRDKNFKIVGMFK